MISTLSWRLAWRNLWRHRRRTLLTVAGMVFCNSLLVVLITLQLGSYRMMIDNALAATTGHLQIQHEAYLQQPQMRHSVPQVRVLAEELRALGLPASVAARASTFVLASSETRTLGIAVQAVEPRREPAVSSLPGLVRQGRYLVAPEAAEIVLGVALARNLGVEPGDELVLLGSGYDGSVAAVVVELVGLIATGIDEADRALAQVPLPWFQQHFAMDDHGHSIVLRLAALDALEPVHAALQAYLNRPGFPQDTLRIRNWELLEPGLKQAIQSDLLSAWVMYAVLILLVALSVLNTQLMSVLERRREFGVMLALGLRPLRLARLLLLETGLLGLLGLAGGLMLGGGLALWLAVVGFSYPGMEDVAARFNLAARIYPQTSPAGVLLGPLVVYAATLLAALYPAAQLLRLGPIAALRAPA
jgi:ABC-type lipoprotein release transport system permease subunit